MRRIVTWVIKLDKFGVKVKGELKMKKVLVVALVLVVAIGLWGCGGSKAPAPAAPAPAAPAPASPAPAAPAPAEDYPETHLSIFTEWAAGHPFETYVLAPLQAKLDEKTGGKLILDYYAASTLAGGAGSLEAVSSGVADIGFFPTFYASGELPVTFMYDYLNYYKSYKAAAYAYWEWLKEMQLPEYDAANITLLMSVAQAEHVIVHNTGAPITKMSDFEGLQLRGNAMMANAVTAWGGTGMVLPPPDTYEAIRSGIVDGAIIGGDGAASFKWTEITDYITRIQIVGSTFICPINNQSLAKLPEGMQVALREAAQETFEESACTFFALSAGMAFEDMQARGIDPDFFEAGEQEKMAAAVATFVDDYAAELDGRGLNATAALAKMREKVAYYNEMFQEPDIPFFQ